jgi:phenylpyruvate tautomerase PptA (4-oxalocrotonate tautomerase family)
MPLVTVTLRNGSSREFKATILQVVHRALMVAGVPEKDRFHRVLELDEDHFQYDSTYPDLERPRDGHFVLIEILLSVGRSVKIKRAILAEIIKGLHEQAGLDPDNVMVCFKETQWENWSFAGGRIIHV